MKKALLLCFVLCLVAIFQSCAIKIGKYFEIHDLVLTNKSWNYKNAEDANSGYMDANFSFEFYLRFLDRSNKHLKLAFYAWEWDEQDPDSLNPVLSYEYDQLVSLLSGRDRYTKINLEIMHQYPETLFEYYFVVAVIDMSKQGKDSLLLTRHIKETEAGTPKIVDETGTETLKLL
jgi:hypothetical protein